VTLRLLVRQQCARLRAEAALAQAEQLDEVGHARQYGRDATIGQSGVSPSSIQSITSDASKV